MEKAILFFISCVGTITWILFCTLIIFPWKMYLEIQTRNMTEKREEYLSERFVYEVVVRSIYMGVATLLILLVLYIFS